MMWLIRCELARWLERRKYTLDKLAEFVSPAPWAWDNYAAWLRRKRARELTRMRRAWLDHAPGCGFHLEHYPWECTCGHSNLPWRAK